MFCPHRFLCKKENIAMKTTHYFMQKYLFSSRKYHQGLLLCITINNKKKHLNLLHISSKNNNNFMDLTGELFEFIRLKC